MTHRTEIEIELRGRRVTVEFAITERDPSVGIMSDGFEDEVLTDEHGNDLNWELTDDEIMKIGEKVQRHVNDLASDYPESDY